MDVCWRDYGGSGGADFGALAFAIYEVLVQGDDGFAVRDLRGNALVEGFEPVGNCRGLLVESDGVRGGVGSGGLVWAVDSGAGGERATEAEDFEMAVV